MLALFAVILLTQGLLNQYGVRLVAFLNDLSVTVHIAGVALVALALFLFAPKQPASFLLQPINSNHQSHYFWGFALGLLLAQWTYTGFDASAHMAEETADPRRHAPWGLVLSVGVSGVVGYVLVMALTAAIPSIPAVLGAKDAQGAPVPAVTAILQSGLGARIGTAMSSAGCDGDVVLRSRHHYIYFARNLLARSRSRNAVRGHVAPRYSVAWHTGARDLDNGRRCLGRDAVERSDSCGHVIERGGALRLVYSASDPRFPGALA